MDETDRKESETNLLTQLGNFCIDFDFMCILIFGGLVTVRSNLSAVCFLN